MSTSRPPPPGKPTPPKHLGKPSSGGSAPIRPTLDAAVEEQGRGFVASLFMALRTAQIHSPSNQAFETALRTLIASAEALFSLSGAFSLQFVEESVYLNRVRLRFEGASFATLSVLRSMLEAHQLGGLEISSAPSYASMRKLVLMFAAGSSDPKASREDIKRLGITLLGPQRIADDAGPPRVQAGAFALQCYAKLILAFAEQEARIDEEEAAGQVPGPPQLRAVRIIQDLIELASERPDLLIRLSTNTRGAGPNELCAANSCLLSIAMGQMLGLNRPELMDVAVAALFHQLGAPRDLEGGDKHDAHRAATRSALARMLAQSAVGVSAYRRALVIAEHSTLAAGQQNVPHPLARLVGVAVAFSELLGGYGTDTSRQLELGDAVAILYRDPTGRFDPSMIDLLINVLRVFPSGVEVVLESGERAGVIMHKARERWDVPELLLLDGTGARLDLSQIDGYHQRSIASTAAYAGLEPILSPDWLRGMIPRFIPAPPPLIVPDLIEDLAPPEVLSSDEWAPLQPEPEVLTPTALRPIPEPKPPARPSFPEIRIEDPEELVPELATDELSPGWILSDRYRVIDKIGEGGMATVYRVEHTLLLKHMALKLLKMELSVVPGLSQRFLREARSVCQLDDPNIVRVTDFGRAENVGLYLVMELIDGISLAHLLRSGQKMTIQMILDIVDQILSGLAHAHEHMIVHRDMKPDNVMLIRKGQGFQAKILDFGIAKLGPEIDDRQKSITRPGTVFGTPSYMSPEQATGEEVDFRTDIYATGVILYELIAGRCPFDDPQPMKLLARAIHEPPPMIDLSPFGPAFASACWQVIAKALEKQPEDRFLSANAFRNALRNCADLLSRS